jgi:hypothetical protein
VRLLDLLYYFMKYKTHRQRTLINFNQSRIQKTGCVDEIWDGVSTNIMPFSTSSLTLYVILVVIPKVEALPT